jgi:thioredoxin 1
MLTDHLQYSTEDFNKVIKENPAVVVDWFATWCAPCKAIAPKLVEYVSPFPPQWALPLLTRLLRPSHSNEEQFKDVYFAKVDVDVLDKLALEYGVTAMPTFHLFKNGEKVDELRGANPPALQSLIAKAL